ncbi:hypothetical protein LB507_004672 [Fusarium sp. FIESC RH6]|nr:hypothetical protein LB507_004672 [Fusarium sp. FIESC RH6]
MCLGRLQNSEWSNDGELEQGSLCCVGLGRNAPRYQSPPLRTPRGDGPGTINEYQCLWLVIGVWIEYCNVCGPLKSIYNPALQQGGPPPSNKLHHTSAWTGGIRDWRFGKQAVPPSSRGL